MGKVCSGNDQRIVTFAYLKVEAVEELRSRMKLLLRGKSRRGRDLIL